MQTLLTNQVSQKDQYIVYSFIGLLGLITLFLSFSTQVNYPELPAFVAVCGISIFWSTAQTAFLLYNQSKIVGESALSFLATLYLFISLCALGRLLTLPNVFFLQGFLGINSQASAYIWLIWYTFFPLGIIWYSLQRSEKVKVSVQSNHRFFWGLPFILAGTLFLVVKYENYLPSLIQNNTYASTLYIDHFILLLTLGALFSLIFIGKALQSRRDLWLGLVVIIYALDIIYGFLGEARYTLGWYVALLCSVLSSSILLAVLISDLIKIAKIMNESNSELKNMSETDSLTGLANRRKFDIVLNSLWEIGKHRRHQIGLLIIDIDHFKKYNDYYGHLAGDECLKKVASALNKVSRRRNDLLARIGGEEFVFVLYGSTEITYQRLAEEARAKVEALKIPASFHSHSLVTISVGYAIGSPDKISSIDLMNQADKALYVAKNAGRNKVHNYHDKCLSSKEVKSLLKI